MRRNDREIKDRSKMIEILRDASCCRIGIVSGDEAYIVPLNFGIKDDGETLSLYFHSASEGRKIDLLKENNFVTFEADIPGRIFGKDPACSWTCEYKCVMGSGKIAFIEDLSEKAAALNCIMEHYTKKADWTYPENMLERVTLLRLDVKAWTCKAH